MEVILLEKIDNLGDLGDRVKVRAGYGRNYLLPQGKARMATAENIRYFEERRAELERQAAEQLAAAQRRAEQLGADGDDGRRANHDGIVVSAADRRHHQETLS